MPDLYGENPEYMLSQEERDEYWRLHEEARRAVVRRWLETGDWIEPEIVA